jgi:TonB family protein
LRRALVSACVLCSALTRAASGEGELDWKKTLAQPLSPARVALLIGHHEEPEVIARWRAALSDGSADVRAAAARAIYASSASALLPDVVKALATEADTSAASELIRAAATLSPPASPEVIVEAARRLPTLASHAGTVLGASHGTEALALLPRLRDADAQGLLRTTLVRAAAGPRLESLTRVASVVLRHDDNVAWRAVWEVAREGGTLAEGVVAASLMSTNPRLRAATYWNLALESERASAIGAVVVSALEATPEATGEAGATQPGGDTAAFAYELLARARGREPKENLAFLQSRAAARADGDVLPDPVWPMPDRFTKSEQRVLVEKKYLRHDFDRRRGRPRAFATRPRTLDLAAPLEPTQFPRGYFTSLAALTGCAPKKRIAVLASITYDAAGRPNAIEADTALVPKECTSMARVLFASAHLPAGAGTTQDGVRLALGRDEVECAQALEGMPEAWGGVVGRVDEGGVVRIGGGIKDPKKIRHKNPAYPAGARHNRVQGTVILETMINRCGHVTDVKVLRSVPALDEAAVEAVQDWRFTPTLLNGVPVPVIYTVTVNFALP